MKSVGAMIKQIADLRGTSDVTEWEDKFIWSILEQTGNGDVTASVSEKQIAVINRIWDKHFAG